MSTMIDKEDDAFLKQNIKGLMMSVLGEWNQKMDEGRAKTEFADIRPADMRVFGQIRGRKIKLSQIHKELGVSRQAAQQAVDRLISHDMLRLELAEGSKRDKVVSITEKGQKWRSHAAEQIRDIEEECKQRLGAENAEMLREILLKLLAERNSP